MELRIREWDDVLLRPSDLATLAIVTCENPTSGVTPVVYFVMSIKKINIIDDC